MEELEITLVVVPGSEPIRGSLSSQTGSRSFTGWMQLITALQASIEEDQAHLSDPGSGADTSPNPNQKPED